MPGRLIAIEGIDGAGKGTQAELLRARFEAAGRSTALLSFPRYDETHFGGYIADYLNGRFGALEAIDPFFAALLFAGDRLESKPVLIEALAHNEIVICDRYVGSNIAHQGARASEANRGELIRRIETVEFEIHALPRPATTIFLDASVPTAKTLIARKAARSYTEHREDLHEADAVYLDAVRSVYRRICEDSPGWIRVEIDRAERLRSIDEVAAEIWRVL